MAFYIYHKTDSRIATGKGGSSYGQHLYNTEGQAKAGITRILKKAQEKHDRLMTSQYKWDHEKAKDHLAYYSDLAIAEKEDYHNNIEQFEFVKSLMNPDGPSIKQSVNTPHYLSVASESYWCA
jgi:hypothetical protein